MICSPLNGGRRLLFPALVGAALLLGATNTLAQPVAVPPYTLAAFSGVAPTGATQPDDLAVSADGKDLWVGYGNGVDTFGQGGPSNVVEYEISSGNVLQNLSIPGHVDGLKIDPATNDVWATENEDGNPTLAVIKPSSGKFKIFKFTPDLVTGGMDDLVFSSADPEADPEDVGVFIVASSQTDITKPVIVKIKSELRKTNTKLSPFLPGNPPSVLNVVTNTVETSDQIGDPDSMTLDSVGELILDNRSDKSLYIVRDPSAANPVLRVPLALGGTPVEVNDTIFTTSTFGVSSSAGTIFITDTKANAIYTLAKPYFPPNEVYTAANVVGDVGLVDMKSGVVTPVVTGFQGVHGLAFSPTVVAIGP